jgi:hypothetical protein
MQGFRRFLAAGKPTEETTKVYIDKGQWLNPLKEGKPKFGNDPSAGSPTEQFNIPPLVSQRARL